MKKIISILLVLVIIFSMIGCDNKKRQEEIKQARLEYINKVENYNEAVLDAESAIDECIKLLVDVWYCSIFGSDKANIEYTEVIVRYFETLKKELGLEFDFNDTINYLLYENDYYPKLQEEAESKADLLTDLLKDIKELPKESEDLQVLYDLSRDNYDLITEYVKSVSNPQGTYESFSADTKELSDQIVRYYDKIKTEIFLLSDEDSTE